LLLLLLIAKPTTAAEKIRVEIVEATNIMQMLSVTVPGAPEQSDTRCTARVAGDTVASDCKTTAAPATQTATGLIPHFLFSAKVILPDGSHASITCLSGDKDCTGIAPVAAEKSSLTCETAGAITTCTTRNLGTYLAKRKNNDLLIYGPKGKLRYHIVGPW
jgi:hypothetical protein